MLTCFGKPVAHVTLRSATAAAAMHRLCEQPEPQPPGATLNWREAVALTRNHKNLTVAFAPPRKAPQLALSRLEGWKHLPQATATLWLGNVDDFVPRKSLESVLASCEPQDDFPVNLQPMCLKQREACGNWSGMAKSCMDCDTFRLAHALLPHSARQNAAHSLVRSLTCTDSIRQDSAETRTAPGE